MAEEPETDNVKFKSEETADDEKKENTPLVMTEEQREACRVMFEKVSLYLNGELTGTYVRTSNADHSFFLCPLQ